MFHKLAVIALALGLAAPGLLFAATPVNINTADARTIAKSLDGIGHTRRGHRGVARCARSVQEGRRPETRQGHRQGHDRAQPQCDPVRRRRGRRGRRHRRQAATPQSADTE
ncbi:hypothetical protein RLIN73S_05477 [Rhodanobacter lindaniclasticus]